MQRRAVMTATLPTIASCKHIVGAVPGERPTIMQRPVNPSAEFLAEISEQDGIIEVIAVNVMEMNDVRLLLAQYTDQSPSLEYGAQAVQIRCCRECHMTPKRDSVTHLTRQDTRSPLPSTI